jgi:hypothetical protein
VNVYSEGAGIVSNNCPGHTARQSAPLFAEYARQLGNATLRDTVRTVELQSGDVLYVPPYWSVHSEAVSSSVLLDVLSVSLEQQTLAPAYYLQLPFAPALTQSKEQRVVAARVYLVHVLSRVHGVTSVAKVAQALYRSRYAALYPENGLFLRKSKFQCLRDQPELYDGLVSK